MRKLAVVASLLVVLAGAAVLLLPGLVDWNALKPEIAAAAKRLTGRDIVIDGRIRVALLPKPVLTATELYVLPRAGEEASPLSLDVLELQLAPGALLFGEIRFERLRLVGPALTLARDGDGGLNWDWPEPAADGEDEGEWERLELEDVVVVDGRVTWLDAHGGTWRLDHVSLSAAGSPLGPISAQGRFDAGAERLDFMLELGRRAADGAIAIPALHLKRIADGTEGILRGRIDGDGGFEGTLALRADSAESTARGLGWPAGLIPFPAVPLAAQARLVGNASEIKTEALSLRLGKTQLGGALRLSFANAPRLEGTLTATWLDLDALMKETPKAAAGSAAWVGWRLPEMLTGGLDLHVDGVTWRGGVIRQVEAGLSLAGGRLALAAARARPPGGSEIHLTAAPDAAGGAALFNGHVEARSDNLRRLIAWLGADLAQFKPGRPGRLSLTGELEVTSELLRLTDAALRVDDTVAQGGLVYRLQGRPSFGLDIALDDLDLDRYLRPGATEAVLPVAALQGFDTNVKLKARRLGLGGQQLENLSLDLGLVGGQLTVREAQARLAGGSVALRASAGGFDATPTYIGDVQLTSPAPAALLAGLGVLPANRLEGLGALALDLRFEGKGADLEYEADGRFGETAFETTGKLAGLPDAARLEAGIDWREVRLDRLLAALGQHPPTVLDGASPLTLKLHLDGKPGALQVGLKGTLAGAEFAADGKLAAAANGPALALTFRAAHDDAGALAGNLGFAEFAERLEGPFALAGRLTLGDDRLALDDLDLELGYERLGGNLSVAWPSVRRRVGGELNAGEIDLDRWLPLALQTDPAVLRRLDGTLALRADGLSLAGRRLANANVELGFSPGMVAVQRLDGMLFGGKLALTGRVVAVDRAALALTGGIENARLDEAARNLLSLDGLDGKLTLALELNDFADDLAGLGRHLGGSVEMTVADGRIAGLALDALQEPPREGEDIAAHLLSDGATQIRAASGHWQLVEGVLGTDDGKVELEGGTVALSGDVDLARRGLRLRAAIEPAGAPDAPALILRVEGPAKAPEVSVDATAFAAYAGRQNKPPGEPTPPPDRRPAP